MIPAIEIDGCKLSENYYRRGESTWDVPTLVAHCREKDYPVFDLPIAGIPLGGMPLTIEDFAGFVQHCKRVENADLQYPIILDNEGNIADGYHRIAKAMLKGDVSIKAVRIIEMPTSSSTIK